MLSGRKTQWTFSVCAGGGIHGPVWPQGDFRRDTARGLLWGCPLGGRPEAWYNLACCQDVKPIKHSVCTGGGVHRPVWPHGDVRRDAARGLLWACPLCGRHEAWYNLACCQDVKPIKHSLCAGGGVLGPVWPQGDVRWDAARGVLRCCLLCG